MGQATQHHRFSLLSLCSVSQWSRRSTALTRLTRLSRRGRGWCGAHPLRPPAALLHKAAFCEVVASRCAEAALGVVHRWRALTGSQNRPYVKWPALGWWACLALCMGQALRAVFWSVACGQSSCVCPRPPQGLTAARRRPPARVLPVRPPRGLPQPARLWRLLYKPWQGLAAPLDERVVVSDPTDSPL